MYITTGEDCGKAEKMFEAYIDLNFPKDSIDWINAVAIGLDNTIKVLGEKSTLFHS